MIPTENPSFPSDFFIAHWEEKRTKAMHLEDFCRNDKKCAPCLPHYLSIDTNIFGKSEGLSLKRAVEIRKARFSLHSRVQSSFACMLCTSTPVSLDSWLEGEQFYIKCSHYSFKYIAIVKKESGYEITTVAMVSGSNPEESETGTLFRLHKAGDR